MGKSRNTDIYRAIPPIDELLAHSRIAALRSDYAAFPWTRLLRSVVEDFRRHPDPAQELGDVSRESVAEWIVGRAAGRVRDLREGGQRRVLNGTGVILNTNLGRATWGPSPVAAAVAAMAGYVNLEIDLESGHRSHRADVLRELVELATGAESAMVVNNNAAAVYLCVNSFSPPGRVIVSRGELVEIGGSFRLPEILRHAASEVIEIGTTNRTYAEDYANVAREGDVILKVHKSNYEIKGFTHEAGIAELAEVAHGSGAHLVYDLGSGALFDYRGAGLGDDPVVASVIEAGVDAVTMSGDKLLGGTQAGIIAGTSHFVERLKQNPLRRAVRIDKVTVAALQEVLREYLFGDAERTVPTLQAVLVDQKHQRERAESLRAALEPVAPPGVSIEVDDDAAAVGGGSLSGESLASAALVIRVADEAAAIRLSRRLRLGETPVVVRIRGAQLRINLSTILTGEEPSLIDALTSVFNADTL